MALALTGCTQHHRAKRLFGSELSDLFQDGNDSIRTLGRSVPQLAHACREVNPGRIHGVFRVRYAGRLNIEQNAYLHHIVANGSKVPLANSQDLAGVDSSFSAYICVT